MDEPALHVTCDDPDPGLSAGGAPGEEPDVRALGFEALSMSAAILDADGTIRATNMSWRLFSRLNGAPEPGAWVGTSYFDPCRAAVARGDAEAADAERAMEGIRAVCEGRRDVFEMEYPCPSPDEERWFLLRASPLPGRHAGAVVSHLDVTRRKRLEQRLEHSASHDPLTGFPNRRLLHDRLSVALARRRGDAGAVAVLFCDLDGFKAVNDTLGHADGDDLLSMAAARLAGGRRRVRRGLRPGRLARPRGPGRPHRSRVRRSVPAGHPLRPGGNQRRLGRRPPGRGPPSRSRRRRPAHVRAQSGQAGRRPLTLTDAHWGREAAGVSGRLPVSG
jgi:hypothetical protein